VTPVASDAPRPVQRRLAALAAPLRALSPRNRLLVGVWAGFVLLVALGVHGSSSGSAAANWMPEKPFTGTLIRHPLLPKFLKRRLDPVSVRDFFLMNPRYIRWDECYSGTPYALSQLAQSPRFPVINKSIGADGQNMLLTQHAPVWHIVTLARPATWGYFFLGARRGLSWYWWFQPFACFTALTLLLDVVLRGRWTLAALGAFLFCSSSYVVCWSLWPSYMTMFAAVACVSAYHLLASERRVVLVASAVAFALALAGFVTDLYPPWQVPVGYVFGGLLVALAIRDGLLRGLRKPDRLRIALAAGALCAGGALVFIWWHACAADLRVMSHTIYPGKRVSPGGDLPFSVLFRGNYNLLTNYEKFGELKNESEASSFYYLFPAVFALICFSKDVRRRMGPIGWFLVGYIALLLVFLCLGFPVPLARALFLSYAPARSADLGMGIASTILAVYTLSITDQLRAERGSVGRRFVAPAVAGVVLALFIAHGYVMHRLLHTVPSAGFVLFVSAMLATISAAIALGRVPYAAVPLAALQIATTYCFNPLSTNLDHIYKSRLANAILTIKAHSPEPSLWAVFGGIHIDSLITMLGERSVTGVESPPQLHAWSVLDPNGDHVANYNRFAEVAFFAAKNAVNISYRNPVEGALYVTLSPTEPRLKTLGVRYLLFYGNQQRQADETKLRLLLRSSTHNFSIYELPDAPPTPPEPPPNPDSGTAASSTDSLYLKTSPTGRGNGKE
jgi:hypothetical protein